MRSYKRDWQIAERIALEKWIAGNERYYSESQIEPYAKKYVRSNTNYCFHDWLSEIVKPISLKAGGKKCFCNVGGVIYINDIGYEKMIEYFERKEMIKKENAISWKKEIGLL